MQATPLVGAEAPATHWQALIEVAPATVVSELRGHEVALAMEQVLQEHWDRVHCWVVAEATVASNNRANMAVKPTHIYRCSPEVQLEHAALVVVVQATLA